MSDTAVNVVVSSRVRLARNYFDLPFLNQNRPENARLCIERAQAALCGAEESYDLYLMRDLPDVERLKLVEKHLISRDLVERAETGAALIRQDRRVSVMINEEDHLRIQAIGSGLDLEAAANVAFGVEGRLEAVCTFSFDPQLGYLTSCPTNTGTGMRASVMLHLPISNDAEKNRLQIATINAAVYKDSENVEEAKKFLSWLCTSDVAQKWHQEKMGNIPALNTVPTMETLSVLGQQVFDYMKANKAYETMTPWTPDEVKTPLGEVWSLYVGRQIDREEFFKQYQQIWTDYAASK